MTGRTRAYGFLAIVGLLVGSWYGYRLYGSSNTSRPNSEAGTSPGTANSKGEVVPVEVAVANLGPISSYVTSTANLKALRDVVISTQADGLVRELLAEEGDHVKTGQTLCPWMTVS